MPFYKKQKLNGKWYPRAVTKGHPATTDDVAKRLSLIPEYSRQQNGQVIQRTLIDPHLEWIDLDEIAGNGKK